MSQLETIQKQIETLDKVLVDARARAEAIRCETSAKLSAKLQERGINHKRIEYSVDSIRLGATEDREDVSIYTRSQWDDETKVKIEISWYSSSATVGVEDDQRHFDYLIMAGEISKALQNPDFITMLLDTRLEYISRVTETGAGDLYSLKDKLEREHNDLERALKKEAAKNILAANSEYMIKKRISFGRRDSYSCWDIEHPTKLVVAKIKNKTLDIVQYQWDKWSGKNEYAPYGKRQHKISDVLYWIENGYLEAVK